MFGNMEWLLIAEVILICIIVVLTIFCGIRFFRSVINKEKSDDSKGLLILHIIGVLLLIFGGQMSFFGLIILVGLAIYRFRQELIRKPEQNL